MTELSRQTEIQVNEHVADAESPVVLSVDGLHKKFCRTLKRSMVYGFQDLARGFTGRTPKETGLRKDEFWALQDVSFELREHEILGIIGANGSGKSTLLRVLTGIYPPDRGTVKIAGKVGGIIALGAGMHPHMTGRENIYLNGVILGMTRREIDEKFDAIVEFAELGEFLEAPLSTYSSGMKVRLGFAVAVHCQPDILLVDEVLAVGDLSFKNKCLRKLAELRQSARGVIFISHDMEHIKLMCDRVMLLDKSGMIYCGDVMTGIHLYEQILTTIEPKVHNRSAEKSAIVRRLVIDSSEETTVAIYSGNDLMIEMQIETTTTFQGSVVVGLLDESGRPVVWIDSSDQSIPLKFEAGLNNLKVHLNNVNLVPGCYRINYGIRNLNTLELLNKTFENRFLQILSNGIERAFKGVVTLKSEWEINEIVYE